MDVLNRLSFSGNMVQGITHYRSRPTDSEPAQGASGVSALRANPLSYLVVKTTLVQWRVLFGCLQMFTRADVSWVCLAFDQPAGGSGCASLHRGAGQLLRRGLPHRVADGAVTLERIADQVDHLDRCHEPSSSMRSPCSSPPELVRHPVADIDIKYIVTLGLEQVATLRSPCMTGTSPL